MQAHYHTQHQFDSLDEALVTRKMQELNQKEGPRVGDLVRFADGVERRISYHWKDDAGWDGGCQTSNGGSFHLHGCGVSFSGSLCSAVPTDSLTLTDETQDATCWIFHHDHSGAGRGVYFDVPFRVYTCNLEAPR